MRNPFKRDPKLAELKSECHKAGMWYYWYLNTLVCGQVLDDGRCCEKYQRRVWYKDRLRSLSEIRVREYPGISLEPQENESFYP